MDGALIFIVDQKIDKFFRSSSTYHRNYYSHNQLTFFALSFSLNDAYKNSTKFDEIKTFHTKLKTTTNKCP